MVAETIQELNAGANACSVEWCPFTNLEEYVACSTYLLDGKTHSPMTEIESSEGLPRARGQDDCTVGGGSVANAAHQHQTRRGTVGLHKVSALVYFACLKSSAGKQSKAVVATHESNPFLLNLESDVLLDGFRRRLWYQSCS